MIIHFNERDKQLQNIKELQTKACRTTCDPYGMHATVPKDDLLFCICGGPEGPVVYQIDTVEKWLN